MFIYNSLTRKKEEFKPLNPPHVGLYVCGPTVYGDAHLGHARPAITFDLLYRYLQHQGYKVRYVRNITDVGHMESNADEGEDKIEKKARLEELEPMEVVQYYTNSYHENMRQLNTLPPGIEPRASGHIIEQQQFIDKILKSGYAYEVNGSVYFDVQKYDKKYHYGVLSGRVLDDLISNTRELEGQSEKKNPFDFALWKKAGTEHIMRWPSRRSDGFPGWHLECSTMSTKYLGKVFDIHGGGMDLLFPHHECEIAQSTAATGKSSVRYWMHNNMITLNGQKMGKSLGNAITLNDFFAGNHPLLEKPYSPMTVRFFILQAHYRGTVDFSNQALQASEKGLARLLAGIEEIDKIVPSASSTIDVKIVGEKCYKALNDDLNSPALISHLFDGIRLVHQAREGKASLTEVDLKTLKSLYYTMTFEILGLQKSEIKESEEKLTPNLIELILNLRQDAKNRKDFETSDRIRDALIKLGVEVKDSKEGFTWSLK